MTQFRQVLTQHIGQSASDGAGVRLTRVIGGAGIERFDPFLMLDEFGSDNPDDYIAGFPPHPHRGFETITYMLEGRMRHEDHLGDAGYRDYAPEEIPRLTTAEGVAVTVIAGRFDDGELQQDGAVQRPHTAPQLFDLHLPAGSRLAPRLADGQRVLLYIYEGELAVNGHSIGKGRLARLSETGAIEMGSATGARGLLIAGTPLNEPIVQYGPFVMNSREEIEQALRDFRDDRLTA